jgi:pimeloyl-ACP methyl ester carboxylesterase
LLGQALLSAERGDSQYLLQLADSYNERYGGHYSNIGDANVTISCNDTKPGPSDATIRATTKSWVRRFPMFGLWSAASLFQCQQWQPDRTVPPLPTATHAATTVLVVGNLHDPATPYQGAKDLTRTLGKARLLSWNGEGHTSYLEGSSCVDAAVDAYLDSGTLPGAGKTCPA